jgi:cytochrome P450
MENALFRRELLAPYEETIVRPVLSAELDDLLSGPRPARADLIALMRLVLPLITAKVIGLDEVVAEVGISRLRYFAQIFSEAASVEWNTEGHDVVMKQGLEAKQQFIREFYEPAKERRLALLERVHRGEASEDELPRDLLTMLLAHMNNEGVDEETIIRETILYITGSSTTVMQNCAHTVWQLLEWLTDHPEDQSLIGNVAFLRQAASESLRMYPPSVALIRRALTEIELSTGRRIREGEYLYIDLRATNRERSVFGEDADTYNPHRIARDRSRPYGFAFGGGAHMCIGRRLAVGGVAGPSGGADSGRHGIVACVLSELVAAGVGLDDERPPRMRERTLRHEFAEFPIVLAGR